MGGHPDRKQMDSRIRGNDEDVKFVDSRGFPQFYSLRVTNSRRVAVR